MDEQNKEESAIYTIYKFFNRRQKNPRVWQHNNGSAVNEKRCIKSVMQTQE